MQTVCAGAQLVLTLIKSTTQYQKRYSYPIPFMINSFMINQWNEMIFHLLICVKSIAHKTETCTNYSTVVRELYIPKKIFWLEYHHRYEIKTLSNYFSVSRQRTMNRSSNKNLRLGYIQNEDELFKIKYKSTIQIFTGGMCHWTWKIYCFVCSNLWVA